jgi:hypothetical protein
MDNIVTDVRISITVYPEFEVIFVMGVMMKFNSKEVVLKLSGAIHRLMRFACHEQQMFGLPL